MVTVVEDKAPAAEKRYRSFLDDVLKEEGCILVPDTNDGPNDFPRAVYLDNGPLKYLIGAHNQIAKIEENVEFNERGKTKPNQKFRLFLNDEKYIQHVRRIARKVEQEYHVKSEVKYETKE
ncbi:hypothetical protein ACFLZ7_04335 [Nanoarchaeota archaeon]